jgi:hypothetical protein
MRWLPWLFTLLAVSGILLNLWLSSDSHLQRELTHRVWSFEREQQIPEETATLLLEHKLNRWHEWGELLLLANGQLQFESRVQFTSLADGPILRLLIQGRWTISEGFISFTLNSISFLPTNLAGKELLARHESMLEHLVSNRFNRIRKVILNNERTLLLSEDDGALWGMQERQESTRRPINR